MDLLMEYEKMTSKDGVLAMLRNIQNVYKKVLPMRREERERMILGCLQIMIGKVGGYPEVAEAIEAVLEQFPEGQRHDESLIEALHKKIPAYTDAPLESWEQKLMLYKFTDVSITFMFNQIKPLLTDRRDMVMLERMEKACHGVFANRNFKPGFVAEYFRNYHNPKFDEEFLDREFENYIGYFEEVLGDDNETAGSEPVHR